MELVEVSNEWTTGVDHVVNYDSWDQFVICNENLHRMWRDMILLSWACQPEGSGFTLQLVYISKEPFLSTIINGHSRRFVQRCVEIKFKSNQAHAIAQWLVSRNPDLWKMNELVRISPPNLKEAT
jgi:hypothetical protein